MNTNEQTNLNTHPDMDDPQREKEIFSCEKGLAYCGLACCLCDEKPGCPGCRSEGCPDKDNCKPFQCCSAQNIHGCWECPQVPCDAPILSQTRIQAFVHFIADYGEDKLLRALENNFKSGIRYHYPGQLTGDYDVPENEADIIKLLLRGCEQDIL